MVRLPSINHEISRELSEKRRKKIDDDLAILPQELIDKKNEVFSLQRQLEARKINNDMKNNSLVAIMFDGV